MAQAWKYAVLLGLAGAAAAAGCTVKSGDDDEIGGIGGFGAEGGESGTGGTTGGTAGKGGTGGSAGKGGTGGTAGKGGAAGSGGTAGTTAGTGGTAGDAGDSGAGGDGGDGDIVQCDPDSGDLVNTEFPDCEPAEDDDPECAACVKENCCEESKRCYGFEPKNVCGWGGPEALGEIKCYEACLKAYVSGNDEVCDNEGIDGCLAMCSTPGCGDFVGNQTQDLAVCMNSSCSSECFGADSCEE